MAATKWPGVRHLPAAHEFLFRINCGISYQVAVPRSLSKWDVICRRKRPFLFERSCSTQKRRLKNGKKNMSISLKKDFSLWQSLSLIGTYKNIDIFSKANKSRKPAIKAEFRAISFRQHSFCNGHHMVGNIAFTSSYHLPSTFEELCAK